MEDQVENSDSFPGRKRSVEELQGTRTAERNPSQDTMSSPNNKRVCLRVVENLIKPDTPMIPNIKSRLQAITSQHEADSENVDAYIAGSQHRLSLTDDDKVTVQAMMNQSKQITNDNVSITGSASIKDSEIGNEEVSSKPVDPIMQSVSERMASWQKKINSESMSTVSKSNAKGLSKGNVDDSMVAENGHSSNADRQSIRSRLSLWQQLTGEQTSAESQKKTSLEPSECDDGTEQMPTVESSTSKPQERNDTEDEQPASIKTEIPVPTPRMSIYNLVKKHSSSSNASFQSPKETPDSEIDPQVALQTSKMEAVNTPDAKSIIEMETEEPITVTTDSPSDDQITESAICNAMKETTDLPNVQEGEISEQDKVVEELSEKSATDLLDQVLDNFGTPSAQNSKCEEKESVVPSEPDVYPVPSFDLSIPVLTVVEALTGKDSTSAFDPSILRRREEQEEPEYTSIKQYRQQVSRPMSCSNVLDEKNDFEVSVNKRATCIGEFGNRRLEECSGQASGQQKRNNLEAKNWSEETNEQQIKSLQDLIKQEQNIAAQASNALKQCNTSTTFTGSIELIECHRLLLIAGRKQEIYQNEIEKLQVKSTEKKLPACSSRGHLKITDLKIPLQLDFISKRNTAEDNAVHYFVVILRCGSRVYCTQTISSHEAAIRDSINITNSFQFDDIRQDFQIELEIYATTVVKELQTPKKKRGLTPKKKLLGSKSPARCFNEGLDVHMTSSSSTKSFSLVASLQFGMSMVNRSNFVLDQVLPPAPLRGSVSMQLQCSMESSIIERGFLTMFEDVNGFGAWHRRWCLLGDNLLSYWKYPDDEKNKEPIGYIDLKNCATELVGVIPRDICARPNTFELVTVRRQKKGETDTLVSKCQNTVTTTKHWLSADTKEERAVWCEKLNEVLNNLRAWNPDSVPSRVQFCV